MAESRDGAVPRELIRRVRYTECDAFERRREERVRCDVCRGVWGVGVGRSNPRIVVSDGVRQFCAMEAQGSRF